MPDLDEINRALGRIEGQVDLLRQDVSAIRAGLTNLKIKVYTLAGTVSALIAFLAKILA